MPRTSKGRQSQGQESDISPGSKYAPSSIVVGSPISASMRSWLTRLPPEMLRSLASGGTVVITKPGGSIYVTMEFLPPTKDAP